MHAGSLFAFVAGLILAADRVEAAETVDIKELLTLERVVSAGQGKAVHCLLGYDACLVYLKRLGSKAAIPTKKSNLALVRPFRKKLAASDVLPLVPSDIYRLKDRPAGAGPNSYLAPAWTALQAADERFYDQVWADGALNIALFLGYKDQGAGRNPRLFNYGVYAATLEKVRRFAQDWRMTWRRVDSFETVGEVKISGDRLIRIRVVDPHVFCSDDLVKVRNVEETDIERGSDGALLRVAGPATFVRSRKAPCVQQETAAKAVKHRFLEALRGSGSDDIVFYDGHSRFGRGPDFGPIKSGLGEVKPEEMSRAAIGSPGLAALYFNGCSGEKNYGSFFRKAMQAGKIVIWNTRAPNMLDATDDLFLFADGIIKGRSLAAIERYLNLTQFDGRWPSNVRIGVKPGGRG